MISHYVKPAVKVLEQGRKGNWTLTLSGEPLISHKGLGASDQYLEQSPSSEGEGVGEAQPCFYHITWFEEYLVSQVRCTTKQKGCNVSTTGLCYNLVATNWRHPSLWARMVWQANSTAGLGVLAWLRAGARAELEQHGCLLLGDGLPGESMCSSPPPGPGANAQELQWYFSAGGNLKVWKRNLCTGVI